MKIIIQGEADRRPWGCRGYSTMADRSRAIAQLVKRGINYLVCYKDTQAPFALLYSVNDWVTAQNIRNLTPHGVGPHIGKTCKHGYVHIDR